MKISSIRSVLHCLFNRRMDNSTPIPLKFNKNEASITIVMICTNQQDVCVVY